MMRVHLDDCGAIFAREKNGKVKVAEMKNG
jgi:hypothetical protein